MDKDDIKKILAGFSIVGLLAGAGIATRANAASG
jgi:radical SAM modification target selenobiotic family peptide